jgi:hypothetical protein
MNLATGSDQPRQLQLLRSETMMHKCNNQPFEKCKITDEKLRDESKEATSIALMRKESA